MPNQMAKGKKRYNLTLIEEKVNRLREYQKATGSTETLSDIMEKQIEKILKETGEAISNLPEKCQPNEEEAA